MLLAKPTVDIALSTNRLKASYAFWREEVGAKFDLVLPISPNQEQYRFGINGSLLKINAYNRVLPEGAVTGYHQLSLAQAGLTAAREMQDPDGSRLRLVPPGFDGVTQAAVHLRVRDLEVHRRFYAEALGLPEVSHGRFTAGETLFILTQSAEAPADAQILGTGWRYITFQVMRNLDAHAQALKAGAREAVAPALFGNSVRYSMVQDPDGNWVELAQRAELAGSVD